MMRRPTRSTRTYTLLPYQALFRSDAALEAFAAFGAEVGVRRRGVAEGEIFEELVDLPRLGRLEARRIIGEQPHGVGDLPQRAELGRDRKSTRLNSSH